MGRQLRQVRCAQLSLQHRRECREKRQTTEVLQEADREDGVLTCEESTAQILVTKAKVGCGGGEHGTLRRGGLCQGGKFVDRFEREKRCVG